MRQIALLVTLVIFASCSTEKPRFKKDNVCSYEALRYLKNPRNKEKRALNNPQLIQDVAATTRSMQLCYEDFKSRTGAEEFNTCLVVGVDSFGEMEFYNFGSREAELDETFLKCAKTVTKDVPFSSYGTNYILIQSYQFYVSD